LDQTTSDQLETHFEQLVLDISTAFGETTGLLYHLKQNLVKSNQDHQLVCSAIVVPVMAIVVVISYTQTPSPLPIFPPPRNPGSNNPPKTPPPPQQ
jgi:hypothetical protein